MNNVMNRLGTVKLIVAGYKGLMLAETMAQTDGQTLRIFIIRCTTQHNGLHAIQVLYEQRRLSR